MKERLRKDVHYNSWIAGAALAAFSLASVPSSAEETSEGVFVGADSLYEKNQDEIVVTVMGQKKSKRALGYAAQQVDAEALTSVRDNNILNTLHGKVAGVRITNSQGDAGSTRIVIRGETSIAGENQPLFIIDGIPVDNTQYLATGDGRSTRNALADLNPDDIESVNVLKGANAAALYGSRAAHGAIIITTKSGKNQRGLGVSVHSSTSLSTVSTLPKFQNLFGQGAGGTFSYVNGKGAGVNDGVDESWGPRLDAGLLIPQFDSPVDANGNRTATPWVSNPDNVRDFFQTGITTNNGVSVARSGDGYNFRLSLNNEYQRSVVPGSSTNKTNIGLNADYRLSKWLSVGATGNYIVSASPSAPGAANAAGSNYRSSSVMLQYLWFGRQVSDASLRKDYSKSWNSSYYDNPYWEAYYNTYSQGRNRLIGDVHIDLTLAKNLNLRLKQSTDWYYDKRKRTVKTGSYGAGSPYGAYGESSSQFREDNLEALLTYNTTFAENWHVDALAGYNIRNKKYEYNYQYAPQLATPDLYTVANSRTAVTSTNDFSRLRQYGLYFSAGINYNYWAYLTVTGRNDWSSTLPANNNSYFYPSVTGSLILNEALNIEADWLSYLKLRGGWSQVGSDADPYQIATVYTSLDAINGLPMQSSSGQGNNPNLRPERTTSAEVGIEASFFNDRLYTDLSFYKSDSKDQILRLSTTAASGYTSQVQNAGHIRNYGFEVHVGGKAIQTKDFKWELDLNWATNKSKVVSLDDKGLIQRYLLYSSGVDIRAEVGQPYGTLYGTKYQRDNEGRIIVDANGLPTYTSEREHIGKYSADWTGGISNTFTYRNFSLSFLVDASVGGKIFSNTNKTGIYTGVLESSLPGRDAEHGGLWYYKEGGSNVGISGTPDAKLQADGTYTANVNGATTRVYQDGIIVDGVDANGNKNTKIVSAENYYHRLYSIDEVNTFDASYVKLRELSLTYRFPSKLLKKLRLQELAVSLTGRNLWTIFKNADNIDPEASITSGNAQGVEAYTLPSARSVGLNLSLKF